MIYDGYKMTMVDKDYGDVSGYNSSPYKSIKELKKERGDWSQNNDCYFYEGNIYVDTLIDTNKDFKKYMIATKQIKIDKDNKGDE